ncbi:hypothetical protein D9M68_817940 [compost metagenome]
MGTHEAIDLVAAVGGDEHFGEPHQAGCAEVAGAQAARHRHAAKGAEQAVAGAGVVGHGKEAVGETGVVEVGGERVVVVEQLPDQQGEHDPRLVDADGHRHAVHRPLDRGRIAIQCLVRRDRGQDGATLFLVKTEPAPGLRARWIKPPLQ